MESLKNDAQKCMENYADMMRKEGCGREEIFHNLLLNGLQEVFL